MSALHLIKNYLAKQYAKVYSKENFIGVTGSVGKTTTVAAIQAVLAQRYKTVTLQTIPSDIFKLSPSVKKAIFELGVERPGEMDYYLSLVRPRTVVVTKISFAHSEYLGNLDQIIKEKGKLVEQLPEDGLAILNWDDPTSKKLAAKCKGQVIYFGTDATTCFVWASSIRVEGLKTVFELNYGVERVQINCKLLGAHQVYAALAAATLGIIEKIPLTRIKLAIESLSPFEHCMQPVVGPHNSVILDDTLNSSPAAVETSIDTLMQIPARRKILVLGEMRELGNYSEKLHRQIAQQIYKEKVDLVLLGQGEANIIADELKNLGFWEERVFADLQNSQMVSNLLQTLEKGDICLIKGSRATRLDEVVKRIAKK